MRNVKGFAMNKRIFGLWFGWILVGLLGPVAVCGCKTTKQEQLETAARDWCATIRASQVIPVYPLTEDIQPGDIFLVQLPVDQQQKLYKQRGYLPLDNHLDRLNPVSYPNFYSHNFLHSQSNVDLLSEWIRPNGHRTNSWLEAPNAAFPTYSFSVQKGAGINLAFPVEGVPVGLSLLGTDAAEGSVIIKNAHTVGVDTISVHGQLKDWAEANADFLRYFSSSKHPNYLRVVTRIYTVGSVDISLRDASSRSGGLDAGAAKPVNLLMPQLMQGTNADPVTVRSNFVAGNSALQEILTSALGAKDAAGNLLPGGSLRLTAASGRTISMRETFDPPLTIGYIGFDCKIDRGGHLGQPIPTFSLLDKEFSLADRLGGSPTAAIYSGVIESSIYQIVADQAKTSGEAKNIKQRLDALSNFIPPNPRRYTYDAEAKVLHDQDPLVNAPSGAGSASYLAFRRYMGERKTGLAALKEALAEKEFQYAFETAQTNAAPLKVDAELRQRLAATRDALARPLPPEEQEAISEASSALVNYFIQHLNP
jgi:hypothetical protein